MTMRDGRFAAEIDGDFVVFLIGMRINHLLLADTSGFLLRWQCRGCCAN